MTGHDGTAKRTQDAIPYWPLADSRWINLYGWAVNNVRALMLLTVSNDTFKNCKHKLTPSYQQQHKTGVKSITRCLLYGNSIYLRR